MDPARIFLPVAVMAGLTLFVVAFIPYRRITSTRRGIVTPDDFKHGESPNVPPYVRLPNRVLVNLLEMPLLFYVACIVLFQLRMVDQANLWLAWIYVALRVVHVAIFMTYNKVQHRLLPYGVSNVVLGIIWVRLSVVLYAGLSG
jgi:hypothetical protein